MALLFLGVGYANRLSTEEDKTNNKIFDMLGLAIILLMFGSSVYYNGIVKKVDRSEKVGLVGDFLPKKKTSKRREMKVKRLNKS